MEVVLTWFDDTLSVLGDLRSGWALWNFRGVESDRPPRRHALLCVLCGMSLRTQRSKASYGSGSPGLPPECAERILSLADDFRLNRIQPASQSVSRGGLGLRRGDVKRLAIGSAKRAGRNVLYRHFDDAINLSIGSNANDTSAKEPAIPEISFRVHGRPIGRAPLEARKKRTFIPDRAARGIVVVLPDHVGEAVPEIEAPAVRTPGQSIRDSDVSSPHRDFGIRIKSEQHAILLTCFARSPIR